MPPTFGIDDSWSTFSDNVYSQATLYVPKASISKYRNAEIWKKINNIKASVVISPGEVNSDGEVNKDEETNVGDTNALP